MKRLLVVVILIFLLNFLSSVSSQDIPLEINSTAEVINFTITNFIPQEFKLGDVQFNIQLENTGDVELKNLIALVSGSGYSTYNVVPIDSLKPSEKSYIIVDGNFKTEGEIILTIKINDKLFYQTVNVIDTNSKEAEDEQAKQELINKLSLELNQLESNYTLLDSELRKKKSNYDVSEVNLADLKDFLRLAKSSLAVNDLEKLKLNLNLAANEYNYQKNKLDSAPLIKKTFWGVIRSNLLLISSIGGSIITLFALIELIRKKKQDLSKKAMEVKVIIEKKMNSKDKNNDIKPEEKKG